MTQPPTESTPPATPAYNPEELVQRARKVYGFDVKARQRIENAPIARLTDSGSALVDLIAQCFGLSDEGAQWEAEKQKYAETEADKATKNSRRPLPYSDLLKTHKEAFAASNPAPKNMIRYPGWEPSEDATHLHDSLNVLANRQEEKMTDSLLRQKVEWPLGQVSQRSAADIRSPSMVLQDITARVDVDGGYYRGDSERPVSMLQSLPLLADGIEKWVTENAATLSEVDKAGFADALTKFRAASQEVTEFYDYAQGYLAHLKQSEQQVEGEERAAKGVERRGISPRRGSTGHAEGISRVRVDLSKLAPGRE